MPSESLQSLGGSCAPKELPSHAVFRFAPPLLSPLLFLSIFLVFTFPGWAQTKTDPKANSDSAQADDVTQDPATEPQKDSGVILEAAAH